MDPIADAIALVGMVLGVASFVASQREVRKRKQWELEQEKRQIAFTQPDLVPTGARPQGESGQPARLTAIGARTIDINNEGGSTPSQVTAVLFPSSFYRSADGGEPRQDNSLNEIYWFGQVDISPAANTSTRLTLHLLQYPLRGNQSVIEGVSLFAPEEPHWSASALRNTIFYSARLTMTYQDREGRTLATAFDMDAISGRWRRVVRAPTEVPHDLIALTEQAALARSPKLITSETKQIGGS